MEEWEKSSGHCQGKRMITALIACSKTKLKVPAPARDLYQGNLFKFSIRLAELEKIPNIFILSAKYGLLELSKRISPYEHTLKAMTQSEVRKWSIAVVSDLKQRGLDSSELHFFAGRIYYQFLPPGKYRYVGSSIGIISRNLKEEIENLVQKKGGFKL